MQNTKLSIRDILPLTCSRAGVCCHGNRVMLNTWELHVLAKEKKISPKEFRDTYCDLGGARLLFNGAAGWKNKQACSQYIDNFGCSVHLGRPLACRLYPLGRQVQSDEVHYIFEGDVFPCLHGCSEVSSLAHMSVGEYLQEQASEMFEKAHDEYLNLMQSIADIAFMLLLDTGLAESGDKKTLSLWRTMGNESAEALTQRIGQEWIDYLMLPEIYNLEDSILFIQKHSELIQIKAQKEIEVLQTLHEYHKASVLIMGLALHLAHSLGANAQILAEHWIETAKSHGAFETHNVG